MERCVSIIALIIIFQSATITAPQARSHVGRTPITLSAESPSSDALDVYEAVFWYRIQQRGWTGSFFLRIDGVDPGDAFLARFRRAKAPVKKYSAAYIDNSFPAVRDKSTGAAGYELYVTSMAWISPTKAEVLGGMYCSAICADDGIYYLSKEKNGRWVVTRYKMKNVS